MDERSLQRFMRKVEVQPNGCWRWTRPLRSNGYADFFYEGKSRRAHRVAYEHFSGPIPDGLEPDHLCHTNDLSCAGGWDCPHRACVNPEHLELVTRRVNALRGRSAAAANSAKETCKRGHPFDDANTYYPSTGGRQCKACRAERSREMEATRQRKGPRPRPEACPQGHPYEGDNLAFTKTGALRCRACARERERRRRVEIPPVLKPRPVKTHCKHGHEFTPENTIIAANGSRHCRECSRRSVRERRKRQRELRETAA